MQVEMELVVTDEQGMWYNKNKHTWTAAYAIDLGVTLLFKWTLDATLRRTGLLHVFRNLAGGMFSLLSSETSFAEDGEVNMVLYTCKTSEYKHELKSKDKPTHFDKKDTFQIPGLQLSCVRFVIWIETT